MDLVLGKASRRRGGRGPTSRVGKPPGADGYRVPGNSGVGAAGSNRGKFPEAVGSVPATGEGGRVPGTGAGEKRVPWEGGRGWKVPGAGGQMREKVLGAGQSARGREGPRDGCGRGSPTPGGSPRRLESARLAHGAASEGTGRVTGRAAGRTWVTGCKGGSATGGPAKMSPMETRPAGAAAASAGSGGGAAGVRGAKGVRGAGHHESDRLVSQRRTTFKVEPLCTHSTSIFHI